MRQQHHVASRRPRPVPVLDAEALAPSPTELELDAAWAAELEAEDMERWGSHPAVCWSRESMGGGL
jgi:hypothetical protein